MPVSAQTEQESFSFQAEVVQILDLMIHSLYSNKEIFLRELISNASDAIDRLRLELLAKSEVPEADGPLQIRVSYDAAARTITVADNGIGMSRQEVIEHIGTIAKSGTREFLASLTGDQRQDATLIGQFGVGFYSAFIVADQVTLTTRREGLTAAEGVRWESDGRGAYTLEAVEQPSRGTTVVLHLRESEDDLLTGYRLRSIIKKYSDHISLPILMPPDPAEGQAVSAEDQAPAEEAPVNQASALWARPKSELTEQDYRDFYQHVAGDFTDPLAWVHSKIEGTYEYTLLLFIPSRAPFDLWLPKAGRGVKLHIRRVFVLEDSGQLMPQYLRFVRGVIDSSDLPLNVSRELLQGSRVVDSIRSNATKKVLRLLADLAEKEPREVRRVLEGIRPGPQGRPGRRFREPRRDRPAAPLHLHQVRLGRARRVPGRLHRPDEGRASSTSTTCWRPAWPPPRPARTWRRSARRASRSCSWARARASTTGSSPACAISTASDSSRSPRAAAICPNSRTRTRPGPRSRPAPNSPGWSARLKAALDGRAWDVRVSSRLTTSPACIVANEADIDINLARRLRGSGLPSQPVLEINPQHPLVRRLNHDPADPRLAEWAHVLFDQAVLTLGARIEEPAAFVSRLNDLLVTLTGAAEGRSGATARRRRHPRTPPGRTRRQRP